MTFLLQVLLALGCLALVPLGVTTGTRAPAALLLVTPVPHFLGWAARRAFLAGRFRAGMRLAGLVSASPLLLFAAACATLGWPQTVEGWTGTRVDPDAWPHPAMLLALLPFALWSALAVDARARAQGCGPLEVQRQRRFHLRMLLAALLPVALFVLLVWLAGWTERARIEIEEVSLWGTLFAAALIAVFAPLAPLLLRWVWDTTPLPPGPLRESLEALALRAHLRYRELLVWRTGHLVANAAVIGLTARQRIVLLSDALLAALSPREVVAVFGHEAGHARHHHVLVFGAWTLSFLMAGDLVLATARPDSLAIAGAVAIAAAWFVVFGWLSRRYELEADLASVELTADPAALAGALLKVGGPHAGRTSWRHFSVERRVAFLNAIAAEPGRARRLHRVLRAFARAGALSFALLLVLEGVLLVQRWPEDRVVVDLRLGRYACAAERLEAVADPAPDLVRLVAAGARAAGGAGRASEEALERAALAELARGHVQSARDLVELLALRGRELRGVARALEGSGTRDVVDPRWHRALKAALGR